MTLLRRRSAILWAAVFFLSVAPLSAYPGKGSIRSTSSLKTIKDADGQPHCYVEELGLLFLCEPSWDLRAVGKDILVIISEDPSVALTVSQFASRYKFIEQLTKKELKDLKLYQEGFAIEPVVLDNKNALKVKALAMDNVNRRLADYFFIQEKRLCGFLFSVQPAEEWEEYQFIIDRIVKSIRFIPE